MGLKKYILLFLLFWSVASQAITLYPNKSRMNSIYYADSSSLYFKFDNTNFLWNNEYFNDVVNGYTLIGFHITPTLQYHFTPNFKVELGVHMLKYSGVDDFTDVLPRYAVVYHKNDWSFTMGALFGAEYHKLSDVVFNYERNFTDYQENGIQYRMDKERFFLDVWLDWQSYIFAGDDKQEELIAGISTNPVLVKKDGLELSVPAFFLVNHKGGQINEGTDSMLTAYNYGIGLNALLPLKSKMLTGISAEVQYMGFTDNSPETISLYKNGSGILSSLKFHHEESFFQVGYWKADQFLSLMGNSIYQCYSEKGSELNKTERSLITSQIYYSKEFYKGIYFGLMGETFYDVNDGYFDYTMGVKVTINSQFFLTNIRASRK